MKKGLLSKLFVGIMIGTMLLSTVISSFAAEPEAVDGLNGGWETNKDKLSLDLNVDAKAAFEKATADLTGYTYEVIALLGTQVVAGTNYAILVRGSVVAPDAAPVYEIVYIYEDLDGNAEVTGTQDITGEQLIGGVTPNLGAVALEKHTEVNKVFEKALKGLDGVSYEPVAYLGSQVVAGTNYLALFKGTPVVPDPQPAFMLITVYEDLDGQVELKEIETIRLGETDEVGSEIGSVQIPDPFQEYASIGEAEKAAGFKLELPDAPDGYDFTVYRVNPDLRMIEVIYSDKSLEEKGAVEAYRIRKAIGTGDISGDYNEYKETQEVVIGNVTVTMKGNNGMIFVAVWISGEYAYAIDIDMNGNGMTEKEVAALAAATK